MKRLESVVIVLFLRNNFEYCFGEYTSVDVYGNVDEKVHKYPTPFDKFTLKQAKTYEEELVRRIFAIRKVRERYRRKKFYEAKAGMESDKDMYFKQNIDSKILVKDPYTSVAGYRTMYEPRPKKKDMFQMSTKEFGVFKVKGQDYYAWVERESDYKKTGSEVKKKRKEDIEVEDPLNGLTEEEKNAKLRLICNKEKYEQPFTDYKVISFLKGVYYNFLARSQNATRQAGGRGRRKGLNASRKKTTTRMTKKQFDETMARFDYFKERMYDHIYVGVLERTANIKEDKFFPRHIPFGLPFDLGEFYFKKVTIGRKTALRMFRSTHDSVDVWKPKGRKPKVHRITGSNCYELFTYTKNESPDWDYKLNKVYNSSFLGSEYTVYGEEMEPVALEAFYKAKGCVPHLTGFVVNPNAPYLGYFADAVTYCEGLPWIIEVKAPYLGQTRSIGDTVKRTSYIRNVEGGYQLKKRHNYYGQVQLGMAVMRVPRCYFVMYASYDKSMIVLPITFDREFAKTMIRTLYSLYFSKILPRLSMEFYRYDLRDKNKRSKSDESEDSEDSEDSEETREKSEKSEMRKANKEIRTIMNNDSVEISCASHTASIPLSPSISTTSFSRDRSTTGSKVSDGLSGFLSEISQPILSRDIDSVTDSIEILKKMVRDEERRKREKAARKAGITTTTTATTKRTRTLPPKNLTTTENPELLRLLREREDYLKDRSSGTPESITYTGETQSYHPNSTNINNYAGLSAITVC